MTIKQLIKEMLSDMPRRDAACLKRQMKQIKKMLTTRGTKIETADIEIVDGCRLRESNARTSFWRPMRRAGRQWYVRQHTARLEYARQYHAFQEAQAKETAGRLPAVQAAQNERLQS